MRRLIHGAFDAGITYFDLANMAASGAAEECFGRIFMQDLSRFRDELVIATKAGHLMWGPYGTGFPQAYAFQPDQSFPA
ncbi:MAG: aldo/keto reductase [Akkermansia sp.]